MTKFINEAIVEADALKRTAEKRATDMFAKEFTPKVKDMLNELIEEQVSTGSDQPGGYAPETDKDKIQGGEDINDGSGDGPEKIKEEGDLPVDEPEEDPIDLGNLGEESPEDEIPSELSLGSEEDSEMVEEMPPDPEEPEFDEEPVLELDDIDFETPPEEDDEVVEVVADAPFQSGPAAMAEVRKKNRVLARENKILKETITVLRKKFNELNVFNAKLAGAFKLMHSPGLTRGEKKQIAEAFDSAKTIREVKIIYSTLWKSLKRPVQKVVPKNKNVKSVISESTSAPKVSRLEELAGL